MKYLRIASDLHLEAWTGQDAAALRLGFLPPDERDAESILILAGDISSHPEQLLAFLNECTKHFPRTFYVAGNHEFYRHNITLLPERVSQEIEKLRADFGSFQGLSIAMENVGYEELKELGIRFIFGPMWGDGGPMLADQAMVGHYLNDFRLIRKGLEYSRFTVQDMMAHYADFKRQVRYYLETPFDGKTVVITHHLPSRRLVSDRFWPADGSDGANGGFVGDCDNIICTLEPNLWIHGHTHDTIDTMLWKTRIVCNPAGYRGEWMSKYNDFMIRTEEGTRVTVPKFVAIEDL
jgi:hypothetical protein